MKKIFLAVLFLLAGVFYFAGLDNSLPLVEDSAIYINLAKSFANGQGFIYTAGPQDAPGNYYPPFYPLMLSVLYRIFPGNYLVLKLLSSFLSLILLAAIVYFLPKFFQQPKMAVSVIALFALNPQISIYSWSIRNEIPYLLFSVIAVYLLTRYQETEMVFNGFFLFSALAVALACYTRLVGISLIVSILAFFLLRKEFKKCAASLLLGLVMVPWVLNNAIFGKSAYAQEFIYHTSGFSVFARRWFYNLAATVGKELPDLFFYPWLSRIDSYDFVFIFKFTVGFLLAVLLLWGFVLKIKREGLKFWDVYVVIYFVFFYLAWTHHGARYLVPILFFLIYYLIIAIKKLLPGRALFYAVIAIFVSLNIFGNIQLIKEEKTKPLKPEEASFVAAVIWLKNNASKDSIIISRRVNWVYEYTGGLRGKKFLITTEPLRQYTHVMNNKADYIIIDQCKIYRDDSRDYLLPLVNAYKDKFKKIYTTSQKPETLIYKVNR